jgi:hypothetical protein
VVLGASCGLRIFLAPFVIALLAALGGIATDTPAWMASPWAAGVAAALLLAEVAGDKVAGVDQALDAAGLVLRPAWAVGIVLVTAPADGALLASAVAGAGALAIGVGKARLRTEARDAFSGDSGVGAVVCPVLSLVEDLVAASTVLGAVVMAPLGAMGAGIVAIGLHVAGLLLHRWRWRAQIAAA